MNALLRSLLYAAIFYSGTVFWVLAGIASLVFGRRATIAIVLHWADFHHWLAEHVLKIRISVEGEIPQGPHLIAVKHQSMYETLEMVRIAHLPVIVMKRELGDIPLFGTLTRRYGAIPVERSAGSKALREMLAAGKQAVQTGRSVIIFPEGTRVRVGEAPPLRPGFAGLYRALGLPVVPVALDSGIVWGRGFVHRSGTVRMTVGKIIPAGLDREEIEMRVHRAINALELGSEASA